MERIESTKNDGYFTTGNKFFADLINNRHVRVEFYRLSDENIEESPKPKDDTAVKPTIYK